MGAGVGNKIMGGEYDGTSVKVVGAISQTSPAKHTFHNATMTSTTIAMANEIIKASNGTESQFRAAMPQGFLDWYDGLSSTDRAEYKEACEEMRAVGYRLQFGYDYDA